MTDIIYIEDGKLNNIETEMFQKYPMLKLAKDILIKYPDVIITPCYHWYKTKDGSDVLSGYHVNFDSVWVLSVQFGFGNYRIGYHSEKLERINLTQDYYLKNAIDAEIAVINESISDKPLTYIPDWRDEVLGYQTPEQIMDFIDSWIVPKLGISK